MTRTSRLVWIALSLTAATLLGPSKAPAQAQETVEPLRIVATLPELAALVNEIGGPEVRAESLLRGGEDPHYVDAVPSFIARLARADGLCRVGLELEVGWLPKIIDRSGSKQLARGGDGFCDLSRRISALEIPSGRLDRSMGDVHPGGNPHFYISLSALVQGVPEIEAMLSRLRPQRSAEFAKRAQDLTKKLNELLKANRERLAKDLGDSAKTIKLIEYHREFVYFARDYGLNITGSIEEKPGQPPSAGRLAEISRESKTDGVRLAIATDAAPIRHLSRFSEIAGIPFVCLPGFMSASRELSFEGLKAFHVDLVDQLITALRPPAAKP